MYKFTAFATILVLFGFGIAQAQDYSSITKPDVVVTGEENPDLSNAQVVESTPIILSNETLVSGGLVWDINNITDRQTGYDLQSNASTQQVWLDLNNPGYLHAVFTNSQETAGWADRTCLYFGSIDNGVTWFELGGVPVNNGTTGRSGFPAMFGTSTGQGVIANHNNADGTTTHSKVFIDEDPFIYNFSTFDPDVVPGGDPIWPRFALLSNDDGVIASSVNGGQDFYVNTWTGGVFGGWQTIDGEQAEQYAFAISDGGKVGMAYNGQDATGNGGDVFYQESTDGGVNWSPRVKIFDRPDAQDTAYGAIRGVTVSFYGEEPCVSYEVCQQIFSAGNFFPGLPSEIHFWSPNINGGNPKVLADSNNVPYYPYVGTNDVQVPVCRPVLGRSQMHDYLFLAFDATTENAQPSADTTSYCAGYFMYSTDGGDTWTDPEMFTPVDLQGALMDWRYPSIVPVSPVNSMDEDVVEVHMVMQGDTIAGSTVNAAGQPVGVTAQYYHFTTTIPVVGVDNDITVNNFSLEQNYPNPFNPSTKINYSLAERSAVTLKVYDVLGNEVATLVNSTQDAGSHSITFDADQLASGLYIYTINTGNFTSSKKMMLLK